MKQFSDTEFALSEDVDVDEDLDLKLNSYEVLEINIYGSIENYVGAGGLKFTNDDLSTNWEIPELRFVSDSDILRVATWQGTPRVTDVDADVDNASDMVEITREEDF